MFKIGDKVEIVQDRSEHEHHIGQIGTITKVWKDDPTLPFPYWVQFEGTRCTLLYAENELKMFKVDDKEK